LPSEQAFIANPFLVLGLMPSSPPKAGQWLLGLVLSHQVPASS
jgi:hypothetical protein